MQTTIQQQATKEKKRHFWQFWSKKEEQAVSAVPQPVSAAPTSFYEKAIEWTHRADKVVNLVLGYLLAVASVLGFMDVLSNGEVLSQVPWAFYVWLAIMGLGVDFQILLVIGRVPELARSLKGFYKLLFLSFNFAFLGFLAYMSVVIGAVFTEHRDMPVAAQNTIGAAMALLHIDATNFVFQRAALATLLLVLMAVDRAMERWRMQINAQPAQQPVHVQAAQPVQSGTLQTSDLEKVLEAMAAMNQQNMQAIQAVTIQVMSETVERFAATISLPGGTQAKQLAQGTVHVQAEEEDTTTTDELEALGSSGKPVYGKQNFENRQAEIEALLSKEPNLNDREISDRIGCSTRTANKWRTRIQQPLQA